MLMAWFLAALLRYSAALSPVVLRAVEDLRPPCSRKMADRRGVDALRQAQFVPCREAGEAPFSGAGRAAASKRPASGPPGSGCGRGLRAGSDGRTMPGTRRRISAPAEATSTRATIAVRQSGSREGPAVGIAALG